MKTISSNPFRMLGVLSNSSTKVIHRNVSKLETYLTIKKQLNFDFDSQFFGRISRDLENVQRAKTAIQLDDNKLRHGLFWFVSNSAFDEIAFANIKKGNIDKAISIWEKQVTNNRIDKENCGAFINISSIYLKQGINGTINTGKLQKGISLKSQIFESDTLDYIGNLICGENYKVHKVKIIEAFINDLFLELKSCIDSDTLLIRVFSEASTNITSLVSGRLIEEPINLIEEQIDIARSKTETDPENANYYGRTLMKSTKANLKFLAEILGKSDYNYAIYADKIAKQLEQCGVNYFNETRQYSDYLDVYKYGLSIAEGDEVISRLQAALKHAKDQDEINRCWFCGINVSAYGCELRVQMHKREGLWSTRYTYFKDGGYPIGRCQNCKDAHTSSLGDNMLSRTIFGIKKMSGSTDIKGSSNSSVKNHPIIREFLNNGHLFGLPQ